ncbi:MAG: secondary thiamine-phosphate synthase enzyme YjbQ [Actinomycetia bacterium]|nr:secondary thiamine-phosphate synthase enzyme YjbQ [Actinomycetes bacterium]
MMSMEKIEFKTKGQLDIVDLTDLVRKIISKKKIKNGLVNLFVPGSTGALTTIEYEPDLVRDFKKMIEELIPQNKPYRHNLKWGDGNAHSHLRASIIGPSLSVPINNSKIILGTWQQIVFIEFDVKIRNRIVIISCMDDNQIDISIT